MILVFLTNAHTESLFQKSALSTPGSNTSTYFIHQFPSHHLPTSFHNWWYTNAARRDEQCNLFIPFSTLTSTSWHLLIMLPKAWIEFYSPDIKLTSSKNIFCKATQEIFSQQFIWQHCMYSPSLPTLSSIVITNFWGDLSVVTVSGAICGCLLSFPWSFFALAWPALVSSSPSKLLIIH
jgi:uncharacterized protein Usg